MLRKIAILTSVFGINLAVAEGLTLEMALDKLQQHPQWIAANAIIDQATGQQIVAGQYINPSIDVINETHDKQSLSMSFPIETTSVRSYRKASADAQVMVTNAQAKTVQQGLIGEVKKAFYSILQRQDALALAKDEYQLLSQLRHAVQLRVKVGEAARYEAVKAEAEWLSSKNKLDVAEQKLSVAKVRLSTLLGIPKISGVVEPPSNQTQCQAVLNVNDDVLSRHPMMKASKASILRDESSMRHEEALVTPQPSLILGGEHEPGIERIKLGVSLPLPLWHQRDGQIAVAKAKLNQSQAELDATERQLKQDLSQAISRYEIANSQVEVFQSGLLAEAQSVFNVAKSAYKHGERGLLEYIDAQRTLANVRRDFVNSQYDRHFACFDIEQLTQSYGEHHE